MLKTVTMGSRRSIIHGRERAIRSTVRKTLRPCLSSICDRYTAPEVVVSLAALHRKITGAYLDGRVRPGRNDGIAESLVGRTYVSGTARLYTSNITPAAIAITPSIQRQPAPLPIKPPRMGPMLSLRQLATSESDSRNSRRSKQTIASINYVSSSTLENEGSMPERTV